MKMWFRVDDKFHSHNKVRKVIAEDPAALALWVVAGSWSSDNLQDGFVPDHQLQWLIPAGADALAQKLVAARLWRRVRGGYQFHDFTDWNKSRDQVLAQREARSEAGRAGGMSSGKARSNGEAFASANAQANGKQKRTPTRPDQESSTNSLTADQAAEFDEFWTVYPRRKAKDAARKAYASALKRGTHEEILDGAVAYRDECRREHREERFIAHATTWLNQGRWKDHLEAADPLEPEAALWPWDR